MKRWIRIVISAVVVMLAAALVLVIWNDNKETGNEQQTFKIGVAVYQGKDIFISSIMDNLNELVKKAEEEHDMHIKIDISDGQGNQITQNEQVEKYINLRYDVICVNLVDRTNAAPIIEQAVYAGIPVIFFNREPVEEDMFLEDNIYYIGSDPRESAVLQAEIVLEAWREDNSTLDKNNNRIIEYAVLEGEQGHQDTVIRTEQSIETLTRGGLQLRKVAGGIANFDRAQAAALVEQWLKDEEKYIELIVSNNDDMALGALDAIHKLEKENVALVGIDGTPQGREAVDQGELLGTVVSDAETYAKTIFDMAFALSRHEDISEVVTLDRDRYVWMPWVKYTN